VGRLRWDLPALISVTLPPLGDSQRLSGTSAPHQRHHGGGETSLCGACFLRRLRLPAPALCCAPLRRRGCLLRRRCGAGAVEEAVSSSFARPLRRQYLADIACGAVNISGGGRAVRRCPQLICGVATSYPLADISVRARHDWLWARRRRRTLLCLRLCGHRHPGGVDIERRARRLWAALPRDAIA